MKMLLPLLCLNSTMYGVVGGSPLDESPTSHDEWVVLANDNYLPNEPDDNYTAGLLAGFAYKNWTLGISDEMLTHKTTHPTKKYWRGLRTDEISGTIGKDFSLQDYHFNVSLGARLNDNESGAFIQTNYHDFTRTLGDPVDSYYLTDEQRVIRPLVIVSGIHSQHLDDQTTLTVNATADTTGDAADVEANALLSIRGDDGTMVWIGPSWTHHFGHNETITDEKVHNKYRGLFVNAGVALIDRVEIAFYWNKEVGYGSIGYSW